MGSQISEEEKGRGLFRCQQKIRSGRLVAGENGSDFLLLIWILQGIDLKLLLCACEEDGCPRSKMEPNRLRWIVREDENRSRSLDCSPEKQIPPSEKIQHLDRWGQEPEIAGYPVCENGREFSRQCWRVAEAKGGNFRFRIGAQQLIQQRAYCFRFFILDDE